MFDRLIRFSLRNRMLVVASAAIVLVYGAWVIAHLPVDVLPDLNRPTVTIVSEAGGMSPEEVESLVTRPVEVLLNGTPGIERVRSASTLGLSIIWAEFDWGTGPYLARQMVGERLQLARSRLPPGVEPAMMPLSSIMGEILLLGMVSHAPASGVPGSSTPLELRTLADWTVRQRIMAIPGVAQVTVIGGGVKQYQVEVEPARLLAHNLTLRDVEVAVAGLQKNTGGGFVESSGQELLIRNVGRTASLQDFENAVVAYREGSPVLLRHVASVQLGPAVRRGDGSVNGRPAVVMAIRKQPGANTVELVRDIELALEELRAGLPADVKLVELFKQSRFIEVAVTNVEHALRDGTVLVIAVLIIFLLNLRTTAITLVAIPVSIVITALVFQAFGLSINTMTLGGLAVAIGELVDDAIVDVENVFRRLRENRQLPEAERQNPLEVVYRASSEVRSSIVFATMLVILVFVPLFSLSGIEGRLFAPLGIAYILSILASLVVSLTLTPALCSFLLPNAPATERGDGFLVRWLKRQDERLLRFALAHPKEILRGAALTVLVAAISLPLLRTEFLPAFNEGTATVSLTARPGTSLTESNRIGTVAEKLLREIPEVRTTGRRTGRAELDEHAEGVNFSEIDVDFRPSDRSREEVLTSVRGALKRIPGVTVSVGQPISHRIDHLLSGVRAQIAIKIFGSELDVLRDRAAELYRALSSVPNIVDLQVEPQVLVRQVQVRPRRDMAARYGIHVGALNDTLETALGGRIVGQVFEGQRAFDVRVRFTEATRDPVILDRALIDTPAGPKVPLSAVADVVAATGPNVINHENVQRRIVVSCNVSGRDAGSVVRDIRKAVAELHLPKGYFATFGGEFESQEHASRQVLLLSLLSLTGMFLVLYSHFRSVKLVLQVLLNIPLALVGSVVALWLADSTLSVASLVGFVTLTGIASRNTIMMISHYRHLMNHEGEGFDEKMVIRGSLERLVPVLMTTLTAALALVPLLLSAGQPGKEILHPVSLVIFGGLVSSTLMDMVVTPVAFLRFGRATSSDPQLP